MTRPIFIYLTLVLLLATQAWACPSCMPLPITLAEELEMAEAVVLARPLPGAANRFQVESVLRGRLKPGRTILAASEPMKGQVVLTTVQSEGSPFWSGRPRPSNPRVATFSQGVLKLPDRYAAGGRERRLNFFLPYLGDPDRVLSDSAYVEFADAPYAVVGRFAPKVGLAKLRNWLKSPKTPEEHRSLYLVMLGQTGKAQDLPWIENQVQRAAQGKPPATLGALLLCYLQLKGSAGLEVIDRRFLKGDLERRNAAIETLRTIMDENTPVPKSKVLPLFHSLLKDPDLAGAVLRDLALWEDWAALPQVIPLLELPAKQTFVRTAAIRYLRSCPLPQARAQLEQLRQQDPKAAESWPQPFVKSQKRQ